MLEIVMHIFLVSFMVTIFLHHYLEFDKKPDIKHSAIAVLYDSGQEFNRNFINFLSYLFGEITHRAHNKWKIPDSSDSNKKHHKILDRKDKKNKMSSQMWSS
jgi:hypothetical protein